MRGTYVAYAVALGLVIAPPVLAQDLDTMSPDELAPIAEEEGTVTV